MARVSRVGSHATTVGYQSGVTSVTYHATEVVKIDRRSGLVTLNSGGWRTPTTKLRMNQASNQYDLGYQVFQKDGAWFVKTAKGVEPFIDKMVIVID